MPAVNAADIAPTTPREIRATAPKVGVGRRRTAVDGLAAAGGPGRDGGSW
ncbi:hypothetical protein ACIRL0_38390 [Streptomyces sp. NPDC102365]